MGIDGNRVLQTFVWGCLKEARLSRSCQWFLSDFWGFMFAAFALSFVESCD
jgi:hypothetical protein